MRHGTQRMVVVVAVGLLTLGLAERAWANVFASSVSVNTTGFDANCGTATVSFILNEKASGNGTDPGVKIEILNDIGAVVRTVNIGRLAKGKHSFEWDGRNDAGLAAPNGNYTARITASDFGYTAWSKISNDAQQQNKFEYPMGLAVNKNVGSSNFGRIYVSVARVGTTSTGTPNRTVGDGIYVLGADSSDILGQGDTAFAGGIDWITGTTSSPWKITVAPDDSVYITDWSDSHSGVWRCNANPQTTFEEVLSNTGRQSSGLVPGIHGSVAACWVEGTGAETKLYTLDEDFPVAITTFPYAAGRGDVLRYDIGTATSYAGAPVIQADDNTPAPGGVIQNSQMDLVRDEDGSWWITQYRSTGQDTSGSPSLAHFLDGATGPIWRSTGMMGGSYGCIAIHNGMNLLAIGTYTSQIFLVDISNPASPVLAGTIAHPGSAVRDVDFDPAGNLYVVSNSSERVRVYSPPSPVGGNSFTTTSSSVIPLNKTATDGPKITDQPDDVVICVGNSASFSIAATAGANATYQWKKNDNPLGNDGVNVLGADTPTLTLNNVAAADAGALITCVVCDDNGVAVSNPAVLGVGAAFLLAPVSLDICKNSDAVFTVNVVGKGAIHYQWQRDTAGNNTFINVGTDSPSLTLANVQGADSGTKVQCLVTDDCGQVASPTAVLTVRIGPDLTAMYSNRTVAPSGSTFFQVDAAGKGALSYQWYKDTGSGPVAMVNGSGVSGARGPRTYVSELTCNDNGAKFSVEVTDACGTVSSFADSPPGATNGVCTLTVVGSEAADPASGSAACSNSVDDDCDGMVDCEDPDCADDFNCGPACNEPFADRDGDKDVDMLDFASFQLCYSIGASTYDPACECLDYNNDGAIDEDDAAVFVACGSGPGVDADPACDNRPAGQGKVVINEIAYDLIDISGNAMIDTFEFVELYNRSSEVVDISGWILRSVGDNNRDFLIPGGLGSGTTLLAPGGFYVFSPNTVPVPRPNPPYFIWQAITDTPTDIWEDGPDALELLDANRTPVDTVIYGRNLGSAGVTGEGAIWGNLTTVDNVDAQMSVARWFDGRDTDNNGRDFGLRRWTPGTSNESGATVIPSYTASGIDTAAAGSVLPDLDHSFQPAIVIDPTVSTTTVTIGTKSYVVNPKAIPASPQGGKAAVVWDFVAGGGNMAVSKALMNNSGGFDLYVYLDTSFTGWGSNTGYESTSYGVMGTTNTVYTAADPEGIVLGNTVTSCGDTGLAWVFNKVKGSTESCKLYLADAGPGGDSSAPDASWVVQANIDLTGQPSGWYRLSIAYDGATGNVTASGPSGAVNFTTATGLTGGFYVGYRENTPADPATAGSDLSYLRPATFDSAQ